MGVLIDTTGIEGLADIFENFPVAAKSAMANAINDTARGYAMKLAREAILKETAFPDGYLDSNDRLYVSQLAYPENLHATITGRDRPTSLARFAAPGTPVATGQRQKGGPGYVSVTVNPGQPQQIPDAFLVKLKSGNIGMAIRLKPGQTLRGYSGSNIQAHTLSPNVYLLYGPSVDQVFRDVAEDISDDIAAELAREFIRRFNVMVNP
jgi:hypothetical protein